MEAREYAAEEGGEHVLVGCTLPPKVVGVPRGAVLLSVPHILPSTAAEAFIENGTTSRTSTHDLRLPRSSLVRVRWWGEDKQGGSLFRPTRISHDKDDKERGLREEEKHDDDEDEDDGDDGDSSMRMRYPVCVPAHQLIEYLVDMKSLVLDVIDRDTRKKYGRAVFTFQKSGSAEVEDMMKSLSRTNELCEIHSTTEPDIVVGFLSVNFEIEWTSGASSATTPLKWATIAASTPAVSVHSSTLAQVQVQHSRGFAESHEREPVERNIQQRLSFSSSMSSSASFEPVPRRDMRWLPQQPRDHTSFASHAHRPRTALSTGSSSVHHEAGKLDELLEKGRALQRSMFHATKDDHQMVAATSLTDLGTISASTIGAVLAPFEAMTEELDGGWEQVLEDAERIQMTTTPRQLPHTEPSQDERRMRGAMEQVSLGPHNALEMSFESMEMKQAMIDRLRQLREGSVSTRFSPIQIIVSHEHPASLFSTTAAAAQKDDQWIAAFAVNSSLRKRHWRTNYTHTLPLLARGAAAAGGGRMQLARPVLRFRVRCQPQRASPIGRRRRDGGQILDLWAEVRAEELFDHRDREWAVSLPLRFHDSEQDTANPKSHTTKLPVGKKKATQPVGSITLTMRFCSMEQRASEEEPHGGVTSSRGSREENSSDASVSVWSSDGGYSNGVQDRSALYPTTVMADRSPTLASHRSHPDQNGMPLFFALLVERANITHSCSSGVTTERPPTATRLTLRLEYGTPSFFGHAAKKSLRLKRSTKAPLRPAGNDRFDAHFTHMNAFPIEISDEFIQKLDGGLLILEVWMQEQSVHLPSHTTEKLLGVVKIPLYVFKPCLRDPESLRNALAHVTPMVGVDQEFPVVDPLTDAVNGQLHLQVAFGSAEQLFNFKSALASVVKLQSHVRGWLARRELRYWKQFELVDAEDADDGDMCSEEQGERGHHEREILDQHHADEPTFDSADGDGSDTSSIAPAGLRGLNHVPILRVTIRVKLRGSYWEAMGSQKESSVLGCEVHGQLRVDQDHAVSSGPRFTLWWDAQDERLNSHFVHSLQASHSTVAMQLHDMALVFRVEPQYKSLRQSQVTVAADSSDNIDNGMKGVGVGQGAVDLGSLFADVPVGSTQATSDTILVQKDVDTPMKWTGSGSGDMAEEASYGPEVLPLEIGLQLIPQVGRHGGDEERYHERLLAAHDEEDKEEDMRRERVAAFQTVSRTQRLLPATIRLCLDIQRVSGFKDLVYEWRRISTQHKLHSVPRASLLDRIRMEGRTVKLMLAMSLCLGVELHGNETKADSEALYQDEGKRWYKKIQFDAMELQLINDVQSLPSSTQTDVDLVVHPELVAFLQDGCLDIQLLLLCENDEDESDYTLALGTVAVPLAAILFRPSGVQGSFPVRVGDDALGGRVGVQLYIDQGDGTTESGESLASPHSLGGKEEQISAQEMAISTTTKPSTTAVAAMSPQNPVKQTQQKVHLEHDDEAPDDELPLDEAVASIHLATSSIQHRLARLKMLADDEREFENGRPFVTSESTRSSAVSTRPTDFDAPSSDTGGSSGLLLEEKEQEPAAGLAIITEDDESAEQQAEGEGTEIHQQEDEGEGRADASVSVSVPSAVDRHLENELASVATTNDDDGEHDGFFKAITLESFGIHEMELSPVPSTGLSPFGDFSSSRGGGDGFSVEMSPYHQDTVISALQDARSEFSDSQMANTSDEEAVNAVSFVEEMDGDLSMEQSDDGHEGDDDDATQPQSQDGLFMVEEDRSTTIVAPSQRTATEEEVEEVNGVEQMVDASVVRLNNASEHMGEESKNGERSDSSECDDHGEIAAKSDDGNEQQEEAASFKEWADPEALDGTSGGGSIVGDVSTQTSDVSADSASTTQAVERFVVDNAIIDNNNPAGDGTISSSPATNDDGDDSTCHEISTQTSGGDDSGSSPLAEDHETEVATDEKEEAPHEDTEIDGGPSTLSTIDAECQTTQGSEKKTKEEEKQDEEEEEKQDEEEEEKQEELIVESPPSAQIDTITLTQSTTGVEPAKMQLLALPMDKFNIAWEILNEIRALYVHTAAGSDSNTIIQLDDTTRKVNDTTEANPATATTIAVSLTETVVTKKSEENKEAQETKEEEEQPVDSMVPAANAGERHPPVADSRLLHSHEEAIPPSGSSSAAIRMDSWQWADQTSLNRQINERLRKSRSEYKEALALSESMRSSQAGPGTIIAASPRKPPPSLFRADTETERIARIMQGSLNYWLDEEDEDDEEDDDDEDQGYLY